MPGHFPNHNKMVQAIGRHFSFVGCFPDKAGAFSDYLQERYVEKAATSTDMQEQLHTRRSQIQLAAHTLLKLVNGSDPLHSNP